MRYLKNNSLKYIVVLLAVLISCGKNSDAPSGGGNGGGGNGGGGDKDTACIISTISQVNSGTGTESSLSAFYNSNYQVIKLIVYDSVAKTKNFEADFNYVTVDSVRIDSYQYIILDGNKRVIRFVTKSDMSDVKNADDYLFVYTYNSDGYLIKKELHINGSAPANFSTAYTYTNSQLTGCIMTAPSAGNLKILESTLSYDNSVNTKNWIYTFPDALEGYMYFTALNFGKRVSNPLKKVITKIYDPASASLLDTWTTNYGNYKIDNGYVVSGEANGDLQQGIAAFYGKTNFNYDCH